MKYATIILFMLWSCVAKAADLDHWEGLEYDYSNANAYEIKFNNDVVNFGLVGVTAQLYSYGDGRYTTIPQNIGFTVSKLFTTEKLDLELGILYWSNKSMIFTDKLNYELKISYNIKDNIQIQFDHYGLSSITKSDIGLNKLSVYYTF